MEQKSKSTQPIYNQMGHLVCRYYKYIEQLKNTTRSLRSHGPTSDVTTPRPPDDEAGDDK